MPQRQFWTNVYETDLTLRIHQDPTSGKNTRMTIQVFDQGGDVTAAASLILPPTIAIDAGVDMFHQGWQAWDLNDGASAISAYRRAHRQWVDIAETLAQTR